MMRSYPEQAQTALNLQLAIKPGHSQAVVQLVTDHQAQIYESMLRIGTIHFLRFLFLPMPIEESKNLFVITSYDGDLDTYLAQFCYHLSDLFNTLYVHIDPAPPLPVQEHVQETLDFVRKYNIETPLYSAYPQCTVLNIWSRGCARGGGQ